MARTRSGQVNGPFGQRTAGQALIAAGKVRWRWLKHVPLPYNRAETQGVRRDQTDETDRYARRRGRAIRGPADARANLAERPDPAHRPLPARRLDRRARAPGADRDAAAAW